ncbi:energy transducer TonB family protein [Novilysobacter defluvii]|nr:energy transducer TonB [Lysobacter defluvii]
MMGRGLLVASGAALLLAACASAPPSPAEGAQRVTARLVSGAAAEGVRYDKQAGACTGGGVQLVSSAEYESLTRGWTSDGTCTSPAMEDMPAATGYPLLEGRQLPGSAHVLVRLEADGRFESVRAVCATSVEFGAAAEDTVRTMAFRPGRCGGEPTRMAFMVPLDFDPD